MTIYVCVAQENFPILYKLEFKNKNYMESESLFALQTVLRYLR